MSTFTRHIEDTLQQLGSTEPEMLGIEPLDEHETHSVLTQEHADATLSLSFGPFDRRSLDMLTLTVAPAASSARPATPAAAAAWLDARAQGVIAQLSYLEEPLALWESDQHEQTAQIRSAPPQRDGERVEYWEVLLTAGDEPRASLTRYSWQPGMPERAPVAYPVTYRMLARMADSLRVALAD